MASKSKSRHTDGTIKSFAPAWLVTKPTSRSRYMGSIGFCTAPIRLRPPTRTSDSIQVGSCHDDHISGTHPVSQ